MKNNQFLELRISDLIYMVSCCKSIILYFFILSISITFIINLVNAKEVVTTINLGPKSGNGQDPVAVTVNPTTNRVYVINNKSDNVSVIDGNTNQITNTITVGDSPSKVGINPITNRIYVANSDNISIINGETNQVIDTIIIGDSLIRDRSQ